MKGNEFKKIDFFVLWFIHVDDTNVGPARSCGTKKQINRWIISSFLE
jgi:hypothetical protein